MTILAAILALLIGVTAVFTITSLMYSAIRYVPFVPTKQDVVKKMIKAANLKDGDTIYDLGCGDGRFLIEAAKEKRVTAIGIEASWIVTMLAKFRIWISGQKVRLISGNFFKKNISDADVIFCYLFPGVMNKLKDKFISELKEGAKIISFSFPIKEWQPVEVIQTDTNKPKNFLIYVYEIPSSYEAEK